MALNNTAKNFMLDALRAAMPYASLHSADPSTTGANELTGGTYARKAVTWAAAATGATSASTTPVFDVPTGATVAYAGFWSAVTGGTFYGFGTLASVAFASAGTYTLTTATVSVTDA